MNNVVQLRTLVQERASLTDEALFSPKMFRTALRRMLAHAQRERLGDTALTLELALTALDLDYERRRG
jgi:hypothetical protein